MLSPRFLSRMILASGVVCLLGLSACKHKDEDDVPKNESVEVLYNRGMEQFNRGSTKKATESFEEVERQHPYSEWAPRAEIMAAYSAYRGGEFDDAIAILDRFEKLHPTSPSTPYAYYLQALSYYVQINDVARDQKTTEQARDALREVMTRYPDTDYARDAKLKLDLTDDHLAGKEMAIGRYYQKKKAYIAAIERYKYVVDHFQTTSHVPEALHRLVECYLTLGVVDEAKKYAAVLGYNFPGSTWYKYSYEMMKGNLSPEEKRSFFKYLKA